MPTVLNVAEKPSVARALASFLAPGSQPARGLSPHNRVYRFPYTLKRQRCSMVLTSVSGRVTDVDFAPEFKAWTLHGLDDLFSARIVAVQPQDEKLAIINNLKAAARRCDWLIIWTDCDREGEFIGYEVADVVRSVAPHVQVWRARFAALVPEELNHAVHNLDRLNPKLRDAVQTRIEIDLRLGAVFTRFQTLVCGPRFSQLSKQVLSWGPCQFPTLGFVVDRFLQREKFRAERFWHITVVYENDGEQCVFTWKRGRVYDHAVATALYELVIEGATCTVVDAQAMPRHRSRPLPLTTVEMQKRASRWLKLSAEDTMKTAEALYTRGLISYPRTETNSFNEHAKLRDLVNLHTAHPQWGPYATTLSQGAFCDPIKGSASDEAHSPIHPTKCANPPSLRSKAERDLYEFICRHFLACCSENAHGRQTVVTIQIGGEILSARGLSIDERNYLDVYPYDKWRARTIAPGLDPGLEFIPSAIQLHAGTTKPPELLTEADLIALMDKKGIGTDATIANHVKKIFERSYVVMQGNRIAPTGLGLGLVLGYESIGVHLAKPYLRAEMEQDCALIASGRKLKDAVVNETLATMRTVFHELQSQGAALCSQLQSQLGHSAVDDGRVVTRDFVTGPCGHGLTLRDLNSGGSSCQQVLVCPSCRTRLMLPRGSSMRPANKQCPLCHCGVVVAGVGSTAQFVCPHCCTFPPKGSVHTGLMTCDFCSADCQLAGSSTTALVPCTKETCCGELYLSRRGQRWRVSCSAECGTATLLPETIQTAKVLPEPCPTCSTQVCRIQRVQLRVTGHSSRKCCFGGCDDFVACVLELRPFVLRSTPRPRALAMKKPGGRFLHKSSK